MRVSITDNFQVESFYQNMSEPEGYGAFDEDQLYERTETVELPDDIFLEEETTIEGAKDAMKYISPISLR